MAYVPLADILTLKVVAISRTFDTYNSLSLATKIEMKITMEKLKEQWM